MKYLTILAIAFLLGLIVFKEEKETDFSKFDSVMMEAKCIHDSAIVELKRLQNLNDSIMDIKFGK